MVTIRDGYRVKGIPMRSERYCVRVLEECQISGAVVMRVPPMRVRQKGSGVGCYFLPFRLICYKKKQKHKCNKRSTKVKGVCVGG